MRMSRMLGRAQRHFHGTFQPRHQAGRTATTCTDFVNANKHAPGCRRGTYKSGTSVQWRVWIIFWWESVHNNSLRLISVIWRACTQLSRREISPTLGHVGKHTPSWGTPTTTKYVIRRPLANGVTDSTIIREATARTKGNDAARSAAHGSCRSLACKMRQPAVMIL